MATIKKLTLKLKSGLLSELHSDMIFGHFAWRMKDLLGEEKLGEFLEFFAQNKPLFTISDGFLERDGEIFFPKPLKLTPGEFKKRPKKERIIDFLKTKESKGRNLITLEELNLYLNGKIDEFKSAIGKPINAPKFTEELKVSVEIDRQTMRSKEGQLFSYFPKFLPDDINIVVFIKILDKENWEKFKCENILKTVFEIGYGKKKSSGYGQFEIIGDIEIFNGFNEAEQSNGFISLSHYLPANIDEIKVAYYDINVKYGKFGEEKSHSSNPFKPPMLLLKPGSCFETEIQKDYYGRVIKGVNDYQPRTIHNGIAFSLNCILI